MKHLNETVPRNYRMDKISLAYLDAMQTKVKNEDDKKITHTDLIKQAVAYYANYMLDSEEIRNLQIEILFGNFDEKIGGNGK